MIKRLRIKFVCINMMIVTIMLCVIFGLVLYFTQKNLEEESIRMMRTAAMGPAGHGKPDELPPEVRLPCFTVQLGPQGELSAAGSGYYDLTDEEFLHQLVKETMDSGKQTGILSKYNLRFCHVPGPNTQYMVFADISIEKNTLRNLIKSCLLIGCISFLAFLLVSLLLAHWVVKPVECAFAQQRQFVADASHELKTPLTVIMTNAELLLEPGYDEKTISQFSDNILTMSHQMRGLVESLLELARVDNGTAQMTFTRLDFGRLVSDAILPFEPLYFENGISMECQVEEGIILKGSETHLRQVVEILLDNAQKYTAPGGTVTICLKKKSRSHCLLSVKNPGEAISQEDLKKIFKRFYRVDKARSMNHSYGLGLPIAESIVLNHRGKIWGESAEGVNTFFVQLPIMTGVSS